MIFLYFILFGLAIYSVMLLLPKGFLLQEIGQLPLYLLKVKQVPLNGLHWEKHDFGPHRRQYLLLFKSEKRETQNKPIIVYYHGGGWTFGSPEKFAVNAKYFTDLGYNVIMPSYRRLPFHRNKSIAKDRELALQKIEELMQIKGWKDRKIILGGLSAGGNVAALMYFDKATLAKINFPTSRFMGLMLHGSPLDLSAMSPTPLLYCYAGGRTTESFAKASPISYLKEADSIPILIIHGTKDGMVAYKSSKSFVEKCQLIGYQNISYHTLKNGTHLDAGRWAFSENQSSILQKEWLKALPLSL